MKNMCTSRSWYLMLRLYIFQDTTKCSADFSTFTLLMKIFHFTLLQVKVSSKHETNDESITNPLNDTFTVIKFTT